MASSAQQLRYKYLVLYTVGGVCSLLTLAMLAWVAVCIAMEAEPLAALSFLPDIPAPLAIAAIIAVTAAAVAAWQCGAKYHQQYESALKKDRSGGDV